jgi:hypothetical protein
LFSQYFHNTYYGENDMVKRADLDCEIDKGRIKTKDKIVLSANKKRRKLIFLVGNFNYYKCNLVMNGKRLFEDQNQGPLKKRSVLKSVCCNLEKALSF